MRETVEKGEFSSFGHRSLIALFIISVHSFLCLLPHPSFSSQHLFSILENIETQILLIERQREEKEKKERRMICLSSNIYLDNHHLFSNGRRMNPINFLTHHNHHLFFSLPLMIIILKIWFLFSFLSFSSASSSLYLAAWIQKRELIIYSLDPFSHFLIPFIPGFLSLFPLLLSNLSSFPFQSFMIHLLTQFSFSLRLILIELWVYYPYYSYVYLWTAPSSNRDEPLHLLWYKLCSSFQKNSFPFLPHWFREREREGKNVIMMICQSGLVHLMHSHFLSV